MTSSLQWLRLSKERAEALVLLLSQLAFCGDCRWFNPHPSDLAHIRRLSETIELDQHKLLVYGDVVIGYGLLRGWDQGYEVPSLGVAVHPAYRGQGFARLVVELLHTEARLKGARQVRLRVSPDNHAAIALYAKIGYVFSETLDSTGLLVAFYQLEPTN